MRYLRLLILVFFTALLAACGERQGLTPMLENYQYRLSNVFEFFAANEWHNVAPNLLPEYPSRRQLQLPLSPVSVNLLEFLRLSRCDLQRLIGERNSSLGKHMADSQAWLYHLRFISLAQACYEQLNERGNDALAQKVYDAWQIKLQDLDKGRWNASFASQEFQTLFSHAAKPLSKQEAGADSAQLLQALGQLRGALFENLPESTLTSAELESYYAVIGSDKYMGRLLRSQALLIVMLEQLNRDIEMASKTRPLCPAGQLTPRGRVMQKVFLRFYIGEVQPYISGVYRQSRALKQALEDYSDHWQVPPSRLWQLYWHQAWDETNPQSTWHQFDAVISRHTRLWQQQLQDCGLRPGHSPNKRPGNAS